MAIKDLNKNFILLREWNDVVNGATQSVAWANMAQENITTLRNDINYLLNASPEEIAFVDALQAQYSQFVMQQPLNPDK